VKEGSTEAPIRHPIEWRDPDFYDLEKLDAEMRRILDEQYAVAQKILEDNRDKVETMTEALMKWETIDRDQVLDIMAGRPPRAPDDKPTPSGPTGGTPPVSTDGAPAAA